MKKKSLDRSKKIKRLPKSASHVDVAERLNAALDSYQKDYEEKSLNESSGLSFQPKNKSSQSKENISSKLKCVSKKKEEKRNIYSFEGKAHTKIPVMLSDCREVFSTPEERKRGRPTSYFVIDGVASSTSVDHYGTEMSLSALKGMSNQIEKGVPILPRHNSAYEGGIAEWDEVIGRTVGSEISSGMVSNAAKPVQSQYTLKVRSQLFGENDKAKELIRRLKRGEVIGQSIGGWFENVTVEENSSTGEVERVIIDDVVLDHIAITRVPANPDSLSISTLSIRSIKEGIAMFKKEDERAFMEEEELKEEGLDSEELEEKGFKEKALKDEDKQEQIDHEEGAVEDDEDQIDALEIDKKEDEKDLDEDERMQEDDRMLMKERLSELMAEVEKMKEYLYKEKSLEIEAKPMDKPQSEESGVSPMSTGGYPKTLGADIPAPIDGRTVTSYQSEMPIAAEDVPWGWNTTAQDEVLGEGLDNWDRYERAHLYFDEDGNKEAKSSYKLPIARMINGELRIVLRGIQSAMAALNGARGGVNIPDSERKAVYDNLVRYYQRFDKDAPSLRSKEDLTAASSDSENHIGELNMTNDDLKVLTEIITRSVSAALSQQKADPKLDDRPEEINTRSKEETKDELKTRISFLEDKLERVIATPQRIGKRFLPSVINPSEMRSLAHKAKSTPIFATMMERYVDKLEDEKVARSLTVAELKNILVAGLNAAEQDGLIDKPQTAGWH